METGSRQQLSERRWLVKLYVSPRWSYEMWPAGRNKHASASTSNYVLFSCCLSPRILPRVQSHRQLALGDEERASLWRSPALTPCDLAGQDLGPETSR